MTVEVTDSPIDIARLIEKTRNADAGALVTFQGTVRKFSGNVEVVSLDYESYKEMAIKQMNDIVGTAVKRFGVLEINVVHRIGNVKLTEDSVAICCSSPHRKEAFEACRFVIDEIKEKVPIWKKDITPQGVPKWRD